jgi:hypothetical protein
MKDLEFRGNILSGTKYRVSPEGVSLMDETNKLAKRVGRLPADKFAGNKFEQPIGWPGGRRAGRPKYS